MANMDELFQKEAFKKIDSDKIELIKAMQKELEGKNNMEMLPIIMKYNAQFQKGKKISKEEQDAVLNAIKETLPANDRQKFETMLGMVSAFNK